MFISRSSAFLTSSTYLRNCCFKRSISFSESFNCFLNDETSALLSAKSLVRRLNNSVKNWLAYLLLSLLLLLLLWKIQEKLYAYVFFCTTYTFSCIAWSRLVFKAVNCWRKLLLSVEVSWSSESRSRVWEEILLKRERIDRKRCVSYCRMYAVMINDVKTKDLRHKLIIFVSKK